MGVPWKKIFGFGKVAASIFLPAIVVQSIDAIEEAAGELKGPDKKAAVLKMATAAVQGIEGAADKDVVNDAKVLEAASLVIDTTVAAKNAEALMRQAIAAAIAAKNRG